MIDRQRLALVMTMVSSIYIM